MFRRLAPSGSLFEVSLPAGRRLLSGELARVDVLLDDPGLLALFAPFFDLWEGRPSIPMESYLRMMLLKFRFGLGYRRLCGLVDDTFSWRRFCRIGLEARVPDESTIRKITRRCGPALVDALNGRLLDTAVERGVVDLARVRADTTVVEADIRYPTDSGLLCYVVCRIAKLCGRLADSGMKVSCVDRSGLAKSAQHSIGVSLRRRSGDAKAEVLKITADLADLAGLAVADAEAVLKRTAKTPCQKRALAQLAMLCPHATKVIAQARKRVAGVQPDGATRLVSLHDRDARPIRKGRIGKPVEFGFLAQVVDNADGIVLDYQVLIGNPHDAELLQPAIERIIGRCHQPPGLVTADRGYWLPGIEADLAALDVASVAIPRTGKPSQARAAIEHSETFTTAIKWRTGCEGRISHLKRDCGWRRSRLRGHDGARIWCGHGVFCHNLLKLANHQT